MNVIGEVRPGNQALEYLFDHYQPFDSRLTKLINDLPALANQLYGYAQQEAQGLSEAFKPSFFSRLLCSSSNKRKLLALCILDLELCTYFSAVFSYCKDKELASLLVDSLLYQATGHEASSPNESQILDEGTHNNRGIHKYMLSKQQFKHIGDIEAWVFGKDVAAIYDDPKDIAIILSVHPFSFAVRIFATNTCAFSFYGSLPKKEEQKAFQERLEKMHIDLMETINKV
jgi:hypothetical protein